MSKEDILDELKNLIEEEEEEEEDVIRELAHKAVDEGVDISEDVLEALQNCVIEGEDEQAMAWSYVSLEIEMDPYISITKGLAGGMSVMGDRYEKGEAFVPQLLIAAGTMYAGMDILTPFLKMGDDDAVPATIVVGTAEGDVHDIGKNLVSTMLTANGFNVIDLGNDVPADDFIAAIKENKADGVSMSTLMTTTMPEMKNLIDRLEEEGIRDKVKFMIGGAPITPAYADKIGADGQPHDAGGAANWMKEAILTLSPTEERWG